MARIKIRGTPLEKAILKASGDRLSAEAAGRRLGVSTSAACKVAQDHGVPFRSSWFWSDEELAELRRLVKENLDVREVANTLGRPYGQVMNQIKYRRLPYKVVRRVPKYR